MASHRKPRTSTAALLRSSAPGVGVTTAALVTVGIVAQSAQASPAAPKPSVEEVQQKVDALYRQAGAATQEYNAAKEATRKQKQRVDGLLDDVARRTDRLNQARRTLGSLAASQYRSGSVGSASALFLADDPTSYFQSRRVMARATERQKKLIDTYSTQQEAAAKKRGEATRGLERLTTAQAALRESKESVQDKLGQARGLLSKLSAQEKARLAQLERERKAEAQRKADELARRQAAEAREREKEKGEQKPGTGSGTGRGSGSGSSYSTKAEKVLAFARAQIGKPYVWGATGPSSYDCSGLTQAAWKAAGVDLPRTTWDQVKVGKRVATKDLQPGDLVFFYDDISHVGIYKGDGMMVHAPKPNAKVREESIYYMPIYGSVRPV
ncbi:glycoside hydrolase [Streptomyces spiroverticillatus]|uniref:Glycoside hydrolase n=1 Tax=Streptomyces finlayi TaxID=67296 RepID=A0A919C7H0_9ACTN|nr:NlpC/P60 family protein [Streptomyces finlayi]GGZ88280.1 glycoside hydrolase [Streptomyces spiroverticillatus]GHC79321.1 glycoside hydrolase [Streptomyces finlayi]